MTGLKRRKYVEVSKQLKTVCLIAQSYVMSLSSL